MNISKNSQLGLRFGSNIHTKIKFFELEQSRLKSLINRLDTRINSTRSIIGDIKKAMDEQPDNAVKVEMTDEQRQEALRAIESKYQIDLGLNDSQVEAFVQSAIPTNDAFFDQTNAKHFFICESVYRAAELIKIGEGFTGRIMKDINFGKYVYLMGKDKMVMFSVVLKALRGFYYDETAQTLFFFGINIETGDYYCEDGYAKEFSQIMQIITFIELGDIEVVTLESGRNNGKPKKSGKITNTANYTVFVVDSSWNQLIIRTDGFAVRGHFRLQACGTGMKDRKLTWINAFEKHGYTRKPKAQIVD